MLTIDCIPNELMVQIFSYLDGISLNNAIQTCKKWRELGNNPRVWEKICQSFWSLNDNVKLSKLRLSNGRRQDIRDSGGCVDDNFNQRGIDYEDEENGNYENNKLLQKDSLLKKMRIIMNTYLPKDYEIKHFIRASESNLNDWKFVYKFLTTCLIVNQNIDDIDKANEEMYLYGSPHKQLRERRIYKSLKDAIDACEENGIIYLHPGNYTESLTIQKNIHIFGSLLVKDRLYLNARVMNKIIWKANGSLTCINFITNLEECDNSLEVHGSVIIRCCLFKNLSNCGLNIQKNGSARIEDSRFSGCREPFKMDEEFDLLDISSSFIKDVVSQNFLKDVIRRITENKEYVENENRLKSYINVMTYLYKSDSNKMNCSSVIMESIHKIIERMKEFTSYEKVQISFCGLFEELLKDEKMRLKAIQYNLFQVTVSMLKIYKNHPILIQFICSIIGRLSSHIEVLPYIEEERLYEMLMNLCIEHKSDVSIIKEVLGCLWNVVWLSDKARTYLFENDFLSYILNILETKKNMNNPFIQISACGVLWNMSSREEISREIIKRGGLRRLLETLKFYQNDDRLLTIVDERIHWVILSMLSNFSDIEEGREIIMNMDGINLAMEAIKRHPKSLRIENAIIAFIKKVYSNDKNFKEYLEKSKKDKLTIETIREYYYHSNEKKRLTSEMRSMVI